uniref:Uncharacterized protein n=1 Tax=Globisporangium ultimum (strain ATCC 200006 / CBS 805.95 / DAOM BR144) TaxID=431595 RepID=K3WWN1_GLOUD
MQYELVEVHELPMVNAKRSVKKALLSDVGVKRYNSLKHKINHLSIFLYILAFPIGAAVLTVNAEYGRILCVFKFSLQIPMLIFVTAGLRVDILRILLSTYEFWFFTTLNALACILFVINFGDQRIFMAPVYWYGIQLCVCADAKIQDSRVGAAAVLATLYHVFLLVVFGLKLTPEAHPFALFHKNNRTMSSTDFLMNSFTTMMMLLARTAYRNKALQRRRRTDAVVVLIAVV